MESRIDLAILGGSGMYSMPGLQDSFEVMPETPYGYPSAPIVIGTLEGKRLAFLARHGIGHVLTPTVVPFRANIYALKQLGVERIVSMSACRVAARGLHPRGCCHPRPIDGFHPPARPDFLRGRVGGARQRRRPILPGSIRAGVSGGQRGGRDGSRQRSPGHHRGAALLDTRRIEFFPQPGNVGHQYDHCPGGFSGT